MPPFITKFLSAGAATLVDSIGDAADKLITSDEERGALMVKIKKVANAHSRDQMKALADYDKEVTARHANDMKSDSWMSKNVRPCIVVFLIVSTVLLAYLTIFFLPPDKIALVDPWLDLLKALDLTAIGFYFGSRGYEKGQHAKHAKQV